MSNRRAGWADLEVYTGWMDGEWMDRWTRGMDGRMDDGVIDGWSIDRWTDDA